MIDEFADLHPVATIAAENSGRRRLSDAESIGTFSEELHYIVCAARELRAEAEGFVSWCRVMGEGINPQTWGKTQQTYAAEWRARYRPLAAQWKASVANHYGARADEAVAYFFGGEYKSQYPEGVTQAARAELEI